MTVKNHKELFTLILSNVWQGAERSAKVYEELSQIAEDPNIQESLKARAFVSKNILNTLDEVFKMIGEKPIKPSGRIQDVFVEDFRRELSEIKSPEAKHFYVLTKAIHWNQFRIGEYMALIAAADMTGHYGVGVLLESCLADKLAFTERTRRFMRRLVESRVSARVAA